MNAQDIRELYSAEPFAPFEVVLPHGATVRISHPEFMMFSKDFRTLHVVDDKSGATKRIDIKLISSVNELPPPRRKNRK